MYNCGEGLYHDFFRNTADLPAPRVAQICVGIIALMIGTNFPSLSHPSIASGRITAHFMAIYRNDGSYLFWQLDVA